jgi:hypothetical protein
MIKVPRVGSFIEDIDIMGERIGSWSVDRSKTERFAGKSSGSIRISNGLYYTKEEFQERKKRILDKPFS